MNEPRGPGGTPGCFYLRRVFLSSEGTLLQTDGGPAAALETEAAPGRRRSPADESSASQRQQKSRPSPSTTTAAISIFLNTGLASKLQPCRRRLRSAHRRAHAGRPGPGSSPPSGGNTTPWVTSLAQRLTSHLQAERRCRDPRCSRT